MMRNKAFVLVILFVTLDLMIKMTSAVQFNAYSKKQGRCLFNDWKDTDDVLTEVPSCSGNDVPLCYSPTSQNPALFFSCYDTVTKIPVYTAHKVGPNRGPGGRPDDPWHNDAGQCSPKPPGKASSVTNTGGGTDNFNKDNQGGAAYQNYNVASNQYLNKGHLVPCGDMKNSDADRSGPKNEKKMTFINLNVAPQWQPFNGGNWNNLEEAIRDYVDSSNKDVYVFTGTSGQAHSSNGNTAISLHGVTVPKYFWKAICVPTVGSYLFWAVNNVEMASDAAGSADGCSVKQSKKLGVIKCFKRFECARKNDVTKEFMLPPFTQDANKCNTKKASDFLDSALSKRLK